MINFFKKWFMRDIDYRIDEDADTDTDIDDVGIPKIPRASSAPTRKDTAKLTISLIDGRTSVQTASSDPALGDTSSLYSAFDDFENWWNNVPNSVSYTLIYDNGKTMILRNMIKGFTITFDITKRKETVEPPKCPVVPIK